MIKTIEELKEEFDKYEGSEEGFNLCCINQIIKGELDKFAFIEYLGITQADVGECLEEAFSEEW